MLMDLPTSYGTYTPAAEGVIGSFKFNYFPTLAIAAIVIFLGRFFVCHSAFLRKSALLPPVVSGLLFSIIISCIKVAGFQISFETATLKDLAQNLFFAGVGFAFTAGMLRKSGKKLVINIAIGAVLLITLQDAIGIGVGHLVGLHLLLALQCSSASMSGGVATAAAMGPLYESLGVQDATVVGVACGTLGNIMASLIGGPLAVALIKINMPIFICLFGYFISFNLFGRDYGAAVMTAGNIGWGFGSATNCVANEKAVMDEYGWHSIAWDLYPGWSVICDDLYNPAILSILGTIFA